MGEPTVIDRLIDIERRLRELELSTGMGLSGTDQTIKGSHDRLDALLGAGAATPDVLTGLGTLLFTGSGSGALLVRVPPKQTTGGSATSVFRISTTNQADDTDAGSWGCWVWSTAYRGGSNVSNAQVSMTHLCTFSRALNYLGTTGVTSAVSEIAQSPVAATASATRSITDVTVTTAEASEYDVDVQFQIDISGSNTQNPYVTCWVLLVWSVFATAPTVTAL